MFNAMVVLLFLLAGWVHAESWGSHGALTYHIFNGNAEIVACEKSAAGVLVVPTEVEGVPVIGIANYAFYYCQGLTEISLPGGITRIGEYAFSKCEGLTNLTLPASVVDIGRYAFSGCTGLTTLQFPVGVQFSTSSFNGASNLVSIEIDAGSPDYTSTNGVLFNKDLTELIRCPEGKPGAYIFPESVARIGEQSFYHCHALESVSFPTNQVSIYGVGSSFAYCDGLTTLHIPAGVTYIASGVFRSCDNLESITVDAENPNYTSTNGVLFNKDLTELIQCPGGKSGVYSLPETVTEIGRDAFDNCQNLTHIILPDGLVSMNSFSFYGCDHLTTIHIPLSLSDIRATTFLHCDNLMSITVDEDHANYASIDGVLFNKTLTKLIRCPGGKTGAYTLPDSVTTLESYAFHFAIGLESILLPDNLSQVGYYSFLGASNLTSIVVGEGNSSFASTNGVLFNKTLTELIQYPGGRMGEYTVPDNVTWIGRRAFGYAHGLTDITFPEGLSVIEPAAFSYCSGLTELILPASVTSIASDAFRNSLNLSQVTFMGDAPYMGTSMYMNHTPEFTVYYFSENSGFFSPVWEGYPAQVITNSVIIWLNEYGYPIDTGMDQDMNRDGVDLLTAYALNLDPTLDLSEGSLPVPVIDSGMMGMRFYAGAADVEYIVETSEDLESWSTSGVLLSDPDVESHRTGFVNLNSTCRFLRLRLILE